MNDKLIVPRWLLIALAVIAAAGLGILARGLITNPSQAWADFLLNNYYFLSLAMGASFFVALQYISQSGWSAAFKRIPEAMMAWIPVAALFFLFIGLGAGYLYHWAHHEGVEEDAIIAAKSGYLNLPFAYVRLVVFFALWILMTWLLRRASQKEDVTGGTRYFEKSEWYSKIHIFILGVSFSLFSVDWLMSIDVHWYSTLFALKSFVAAFYHGSATLILIILVLNTFGYFPFINSFHVHDFTRYVFMLSIIYGYFWFSQFTLIWYGNIPEETIYYYVRWQPEWRVLFWLDIIINWAIPFTILLPPALSRNKKLLGGVAVLLVFGQYIDLYISIMPGSKGSSVPGFMEIGSWLGFAALFLLVTLLTLRRYALIPKNHPYLEESIEHEFV
jgi:hypothetical protein